MKNLARIIFAMSFVFSLYLIMPYQASAWDMHRMRNAPEWGRQLNSSQKIAAQKIIDENINNTAPIRQSLSNKYADLNLLLCMETPDREKVEKLSREIGELRGNLLEERIKAREKMRKQGLPDGYFGSGRIHEAKGNRRWGFYNLEHNSRKNKIVGMDAAYICNTTCGTAWQ